jgi:hypothetical protein
MSRRDIVFILLVLRSRANCSLRKDGFLYSFGLADNRLLYRTPVTRCRRRNADHGRLAFCSDVGGNLYGVDVTGEKL